MTVQGPVKKQQPDGMSHRGVVQARISAIQILHEIFVRNLFGVFKALCTYTLSIASAHLLLGTVHDLFAHF